MLGSSGLLYGIVSLTSIEVEKLPYCVSHQSLGMGWIMNYARFHLFFLLRYFYQSIFCYRSRKRILNINSNENMSLFDKSVPMVVNTTFTTFCLYFFKLLFCFLHSSHYLPSGVPSTSSSSQSSSLCLQEDIPKPHQASLLPEASSLLMVRCISTH